MENNDILNEQTTILEENMKPKASKRKTIISLVAIFMLVILLGVACALLVRYFVFETYIVDGISMYPTLDGGAGPNSQGSSQEERTDGDICILNKLAKIKRNDIIVFTPNWDATNGKTLIKRVIAIEGDTIQIINSDVYVNGELIEEPYIYEEMYPTNLTFTLQKDEYFCMGDNRNNSLDCRYGGPITKDCIVGKVIIIRGINGKTIFVK